MILYINSADFNNVSFALVAGKKVVKKVYKINSHQSHQTLQKLSEFLSFAKVQTEQLKKIITSKGPGSYTGIRVGLSHALALGLGLGIPVKVLPQEKIAEIYAKF